MENRRTRLNRRIGFKVILGGIAAGYLLLAGYLLINGRFHEDKGMRETALLQSEAESDGKPAERAKKIALTFDDGPHPVYTPMLLEGLKKRDVKVTFFLMGSAVEKYPDIVKRISDDGHLIGNHTYHHVGLDNADEKLIQSEVVSANELIEQVAGERPQFIRPPFGQCNDQIETDTGMICVLWSIDPQDWCTNDASKVVKRVLANARENGIILMHDQYKTSVMAAFTIIDELQKEGYEFVTVDELLLD